MPTFGVQKIKHYDEGYYLIEYDNWDELANSRQPECGVPMKDLQTRSNIVFDNVSLLSQTWFDRVYPAINGYYYVSINGKHNLLEFSGQPIVGNYQVCLTSFDGQMAYCCENGALYSIEESSGKKLLKKLPELKAGHYYFHREHITDRIELLKYLSKCSRTDFPIRILDEETGLKNVITKDGHLLFDRWYEDLIGLKCNSAPNKTVGGFPEDATRLPEFYNGTYEYLKSIGLQEI